MNEIERENGLEKKTNVGRRASRSGLSSAVFAIVVGAGMIVAAILLSNVFSGTTHVVEPTNVITVSSTYPTTEMYTGENFTFYINWTASHDVKDVMLNIEIIKPDVSLNDTSVSFSWPNPDAPLGYFLPATLTDQGDRFVVVSAPMNVKADITVSYLVQMCYKVTGDWSVNFWADGSLA